MGRRQVLHPNTTDRMSNTSPRTTYALVLGAVMNFPGEIPLGWTCGPATRTRKHPFCFTRQLTAYIMRIHFGYGVQSIADTSSRHYGTISRACKVIAGRMTVERAVWEHYAHACASLGVEPGPPVQPPKREKVADRIRPLRYTAAQRAELSSVMHGAVLSVPA